MEKDNGKSAEAVCLTWAGRSPGQVYAQQDDSKCVQQIAATVPLESLLEMQILRPTDSWYLRSKPGSPRLSNFSGGFRCPLKFGKSWSQIHWITSQSKNVILLLAWSRVVCPWGATLASVTSVSSLVWSSTAVWKHPWFCELMDPAGKFSPVAEVRWQLCGSHLNDWLNWKFKMAVTFTCLAPELEWLMASWVSLSVRPLHMASSGFLGAWLSHSAGTLTQWLTSPRVCIQEMEAEAARSC